VTLEASASATADHRSLAATLAPSLADACDGRLGDITWFKADWQRGGAATGTSTFRINDGVETPVVIKLPVTQRELTWTRRLQDDADPEPVVPRLYAAGDSLAGYDLTWLVIEKFPVGPLGLHWHEDHVPRIAEATARFHAAAARYPVDQPPRIEPWDDLAKQAVDSIKTNRVEHHKRWTKALKTFRDRLDDLVAAWEQRDVKQWLHGDLHLANAMSRHAVDHNAVALIDLAEVHAGHWIEDAVYLERQLWARPQRMKPHKPVRSIAKARREWGLPVEEDYARLAMIRRALLAGTAPRFISSEGHPKHFEACLEWLERSLNELK
jgi:hypothetical protein